MRLSHPFVRLSLRPSVPYRRVSRKQKKRRKIEIDINVPNGTSKWCQFSVERSKVKVTGRKPHKTGVMGGR